MHRGALIVLFFLLACTAPQEVTHRNDASSRKPRQPFPSTRTVVKQSTEIKPRWVLEEAYSDPEQPDFRFFCGFSSGRNDLDQAQRTAHADALEQAAAFLETHVVSDFERIVESQMARDRDVYLEIVTIEARTRSDVLIEGAELAAPAWWVRYDDGTFDCHQLVKIEHKNLNPRQVLIRSLRKAAAFAHDEAEQIAFTDGILSLLPGDLLAHFVKARALQASNRPADALAVLEELRRLNGRSALDLHDLAAAAEIDVPDGYPRAIDLDELIFALTPHWEMGVKGLFDIVNAAQNASIFKAHIGQQHYFVSDYPEYDADGEPPHPVSVILESPGSIVTWYVLFWIDAEGLFQVNDSAPEPDRIPASKGINLTLGTCNGRVDLLLLASSNNEELESLVRNFGLVEGLSRSEIETLKDRDETNRLYGLVAALEKLAAREDSFVASAAWFEQAP